MYRLQISSYDDRTPINSGSITFPSDEIIPTDTPPVLVANLQTHVYFVEEEDKYETQIIPAADSPSSVISADEMCVRFSISTPRYGELTFSVAAKDPGAELRDQDIPNRDSGAHVSHADNLLL